MNSTRNVLVLAGHIVLAALAIIAFAEHSITGQQLVCLRVALQIPSLVSIKKPAAPPPPGDFQGSDITFTVGKGGAGGTSSPPSGKAGKFLSRIVVLGGLFVGGLELEACSPVSSAPSISTPEAEAVAGGACKVLEAFTANAVVKTVCANSDELVEAGSLILRMREQTSAGMPVYARGPCKPIPSTAVCASNDEMLEAIDSIFARRGKP